MKKFTAGGFTSIRNDINAALAVVGKKYDMQLSIDCIRFTPTTFRTKLNAVKNGAVENDTPAADNQEIKWKSQFLAHPERFGMTAKDLNVSVSINNTNLTIIGARPKARAQIVLRDSTGNHVAYKSSTVLSALKSVVR